MTAEAEPGAVPPPPVAADRPMKNGWVLTFRHPLWVRVGHWVNVCAVVVLIMSGLNILAAHPHLYWGLKSTFDDPWVSFGRIPNWAMIPQIRNLAEARGWHFTFAWVFVLNGLIYLALLIGSGRLAKRFWPTREDVRGIGHSVVEHARLRFPKDEKARAYNVLQKLTYLAMVLIVLPMMLITGLSMSPGFNAIGGILLDVMGGRQSARTLHFLSAMAILGFIAIHVGLVIWTGLFNNMRAITTGWFAIAPSRPDEDPK